MPTVRRDDATLYYEESAGERPDAAPVAFVEPAGLGAWVWGWQHRAVAGPRGALVTDLRGTGRSTWPDPDESLSLTTLAADLEAVLAAAEQRRVHLVGQGLGGLVALAHAREHGRAASLTLLGTPPAGERIDGDALAASHVDPDGADRTALRETLDVLLSATFRERQPEVLDGIVEWRREDDPSAAAFAAQAAAMERADATGWLHEVTVPALVVHGEADRIVPVAAGRDLADGLPRGELRTVAGAGHLVGVEASRPVNDALVGFLADQEQED